MGVILINIMIKQSYITVTERSQVAICKGYTIPQEIKENAPKLPGEPSMDISMVLHSPVKTLTGVKGKVIKINEPTTKEFGDDTLDFQDVYIKDKKDKVCVALWDKMVSTLKVGQLAKISKCKVKLFKGEKKQSSTFEILNHDDDLDSVSSKEENGEEKEDNSENNDSLEAGSITAVFDMDPYLSCPNKGCNNTKLITFEENGKYLMKCKTCKGQFTTSVSHTYLRGSVYFEKADKSGAKVAIFLPQIRKIFESRGTQFEMSFDKNKLMEQFFEIVPVQARVKIFNNTIRNLVMKSDIHVE